MINDSYFAASLRWLRFDFALLVALGHCSHCFAGSIWGHLTSLRTVSEYCDVLPCCLYMCNVSEEKKGTCFMGSLLTYDKRHKALNVPDEAHPEVAVLAFVADEAIAEVHAPTAVATGL